MAENQKNGANLNDSDLEKVTGGGLSIFDAGKGKMALAFVAKGNFSAAMDVAEKITDGIYRAYVINEIKKQQVFTASDQL